MSDLLFNDPDIGIWAFMALIACIFVIMVYAFWIILGRK